MATDAFDKTVFEQDDFIALHIFNDVHLYNYNVEFYNEIGVGVKETSDRDHYFFIPWTSIRKIEYYSNG